MLPCVCIVGFIALFVFIIVVSVISSRKRKLQYLPPKISIEGHGINRGLTAVEAGILLEEPLDKILTMILFSVVKKNAATVTTKDPLAITLTDPLPEGLYPYETDFLHAFANPNVAEQRHGLQDMMVNLVKSVSEKMKGFSRKETIVFYRDIIKRAGRKWKLHRRPTSRARNTTRSWIGPCSTKITTSAPALPSAYTRSSCLCGGAAMIPVIGALLLAEFHRLRHRISARDALPACRQYAHLAGRCFCRFGNGQRPTVSNNVLGNLSSFTSGVTNKTNPVPVAPPSSYHGGGFGGGGGHACACACACAGCACACAGGGR